MKPHVKFLIDKSTKGDGLELTGFPNVISAQQCLLAQSHNSINNLLPSVVTSSLEMDTFSSDTAGSAADTQDSQPSTALFDGDDGDFIIQNWRLHYSQFPGICRFFSRERNNIQPDVLLAAIQGIISDSETLDCERVDLKWSSYLEGALAQSKCSVRDNGKDEDSNRLIMAYLDDTIAELIASQHKVIELNNIVSTNTNKHHITLQQTIKRMSVMSEQLSIISKDLQKSLIFNVEPRNNPSSLVTTSASSMAIVPRSPRFPQKSFSIVHDGVRLTVTLCPDNASNAKKHTVEETQDSEENSTLSEASQLELHHLMLSSIIKLTKSTKSLKDET